MLARARDPLPRRTVDRDRMAAQEVLHAAHVVAVVVGAEDGRGRQALAREEIQHRSGIARVDNRYLPGRAADQPDIVVLEGRDV